MPFNIILRKEKRVMIKDSAKTDINNENTEKDSFVSEVLNNLVTYSNDEIIVCDSFMNIIMSNSNIVKNGGNILNKLRICQNHINMKNVSFNRTILTSEGKLLYKVTIVRLSKIKSVRDGYLFILKNISLENKYKQKFDSCISLLKHDLRTAILSHITALKLVLKSDKNKNLLPEILNSCVFTNYLIKNFIDEADKFEYTISKKETGLKAFTKDLLKECQPFLALKRTRIELSLAKDTKFVSDGKLLKKALANILFQINERGLENSTIRLNIKRSRNNLKFQIYSMAQILDKSEFSAKVKVFKKFDKIGNLSGLTLASKIIDSFSGKISVENVEDGSVLTILIPV